MSASDNPLIQSGISEGASHPTNATARKRSRSPAYPPFVLDYRPYTSGQLEKIRTLCLSHHEKQWNLYYRNNSVNGYKDRHYILREFDELRAAIEMARGMKSAEADPAHVVGKREEQCPSLKVSSPAVPLQFSWMEAGCGVGNAMLPIFEAYGDLPQWKALVGFDISSTAIHLLEKKKAALPSALREKMHVFVHDPTLQDVVERPYFKASQGCQGEAEHLSANSSLPRKPLNLVNFVSLVFVLCSIPVDRHEVVLRRIAACMTQPGGVLFFRDYGVSDHAEKRFQEGSKQVSDKSASTYARTNGTLSHFFSLEEVKRLFEAAGFKSLDLREVRREVHNHKAALSLSRSFVQGRFILDDV